MVKSSELKFSASRDERSLILIANFINGYTTDFKFELPESFRDALDIKLTPKTILGKTENLYTQGRNYSFKDGDVIHNTKDAYLLEWGEALRTIKYSIQIIMARDASTEITESYETLDDIIKLKYIKKSEDDKVIERNKIIFNKYTYDPGYVKFKLLRPNDNKSKLIEEGVFETTQEYFVLFLQSAILITIDKQKLFFK
ncbi:MAG: hypothetical protein P8X47_10650 [Ignavibacteriaceae bacterium]